MVEAARRLGLSRAATRIKGGKINKVMGYATVAYLFWDNPG